DRLRQSAGENCLRRAGDVLEQHVPARDKGRDDERDLVRLADDDPLDVGDETAPRLGDSVRVLGRLPAQLGHVEAKVYENVASSTTWQGQPYRLKRGSDSYASALSCG